VPAEQFINDLYMMYTHLTGTRSWLLGESGTGESPPVRPFTSPASESICRLIGARRGDQSQPIINP
jgi:hypothetical protein